jgi:uncharacterized protein (DUF2384 family)
VSYLFGKSEPANPLDEAVWASRITLVTSRSQQLFRSRPGYSGEWLCTPDSALKGRTPLQAVSTDSGFQAVKDLLAKIEDGMYA